MKFACVSAYITAIIVCAAAHSHNTTTEAAVSPAQFTLLSHSAFPNHKLRANDQSKLCDPTVKQVSGYLDVDDEKHFYFWFFESRQTPSKDPLVLWLNGGPGCSSLTGLLMELGPCIVNPGGNGTRINKHSWNNKANIIFLDQPVNTGFSWTDGKEVSSTEEAAADVYAFLQVFLKAYPQFATAEFHVTGESYAGHYIPAIGDAIVQGNQQVKLGSFAKLKFSNDDDDVINVNLNSVAIGNGLTDPLVQYEYYPEMACNSNYGSILPEHVCAEMKSKVATCKSLIDACYKWENRFTCVPGSIYCNNALIAPVQRSGKNLYDIRMECEPNNPLCYPIIRDIESYLNRQDVQEALGVDRPYKGCNMDVNLKFLMNGDWMKPFVRAVPTLLEEGIRVLIYAGDADFICNWMGNKAWTLKLEWFGQDGFNAAEDLAWNSTITKKPAGIFRTYEGLTFLRIFEAGHMVPYDQREHSIEFFNYWLSPTDVTKDKEESTPDYNNDL